MHVEACDPSHLLDLLVGHAWDCVIVIDAVRRSPRATSGPGSVTDPLAPAGRDAHAATRTQTDESARGGLQRDAGELIVLQTGPGLPQLPALVDPGTTGTHALGLTATIELARAVDQLPPWILVVGIIGRDFDLGAPMTAEVREAVPRACREVLDRLSELG